MFYSWRDLPRIQGFSTLDIFTTVSKDVNLELELGLELDLFAV